MENNNLPLVSVVIPCYNHEQFVQDSIQSVIDQTYLNIELIIIDDGSKDSSVDKIQQMIPACEQRFTRFEFRSRPNKGLSATLNETIELANGEYWSTCSSDDLYHKDKVRLQVNSFLNNPDQLCSLTLASVVDDNGVSLDFSTDQYNSKITSGISFEDIFTFKINLPVTMMYKTSFINDELEGFDEELTAEDFDINLRTAAKTKISLINEKLYNYRSPMVVGSNRKRPIMRLDVSESHLSTLNKYKEHELYSTALREWNYRRFILFSAYTQTKLYAVCGLMGSFHMWRSLYFYKAMFRILFFWKDYNAK